MMRHLAAMQGAILLVGLPVHLSGAPPGRARSPQPADQAVMVSADVTLYWTAGHGAAGHRVHFGTTPPGLYRGSRTDTGFNPGPLVPGHTYYWRIDEVNAEGTTAGEVWRFTVKPPRPALDADDDGDVDLDDFGYFQGCVAGSGVTVAPSSCGWTDLDGDGDADAVDLHLFARCLGGPQLPPPVPCQAPTPPPGPIPPRPADALTGRAFFQEVRDLSLAAREARVLEEALKGNIPEFLRNFVPVRVTTTIGGTVCQGRFEVMPDYLGIGANGDFIRMPMTPATAQRIADRFECVLTTRRICDLAWQASSDRVSPSPISPSTTDITLMTTFYQHHVTVESQLAALPAFVRGDLVAGIKKDVVISRLLPANPGRVAIYGWHYLNGTPIQPLYLGHTQNWVDYSHGIRLVRGYMTVNGQTWSVTDILRHPQLHVLLSDEGAIDEPRYAY